MKLEDFDYYLPEELIAQTPLNKRDESRLMVLDKKTGNIEDKKFYDVIDYLEEGDALVLNDTKVLPARLIGVKEETQAVIEVLLLKQIEDNNGRTLVSEGIDANYMDMINYSIFGIIRLELEK